MARAARSQLPTTQPQSFLDCLRYFLTPQVWKQVLRAFQPYQAIRWRPQPLLLTLLVMTWCAGDSLEERFESAKAFYIASYQRKRRPGKTVAGFHKALTRLPARALRSAAAAVRARLEQVFAHRLVVDGFVPLGCDGSRLECPRTPELEKRLQVKPNKPLRPKDPPAPAGEPEAAAKPKQPYLPMVFVSAFVHLSTGMLWSWRLGGPRASEPDHLVRLLPTLPRRALVVADAGYVGYPLLRTLTTAQRSFLIRLSSKAPLYTPEQVALSRFREGVAYYWPQDVQQDKLPPIPVRVIRLRQGRKIDVWLMTDVMDSNRLPLSLASTFYRWRWRNEGLFRTYKRTFGKVKLLGRTVAEVHREAESSLLAVQLVLAQGLLALEGVGEEGSVLPSARLVLLEIRAEIRDATGSYLGPRQHRSYLERLRQARRKRRKRRKNQVRRPWPGRAPHKPPKPPRFLKMGTDLKDLLTETLGSPQGVVC